MRLHGNLIFQIEFECPVRGGLVVDVGPGVEDEGGLVVGRLRRVGAVAVSEIHEFDFRKEAISKSDAIIFSGVCNKRGVFKIRAIK